MAEIAARTLSQRPRPEIRTGNVAVRQLSPAGSSPGATRHFAPRAPAAVTLLSAENRKVLDEGLEDALGMLHADRGNIQIVDPATGSLVMASHTGFSDEFLEYFASLNDDGSACGRAAQQVAQTVIPDVNADSGFAPHRGIAASSGFRAVQSTPLVDVRGRLVGVLSTHYPRPYRPSAADLGLARRFGELIGQALEESTAEPVADAALAYSVSAPAAR